MVKTIHVKTPMDHVIETHKLIPIPDGGYKMEPYVIVFI